MYDVFVMDFGNQEQRNDMFNYGVPMHSTHTRYFGTHLETIRRCVSKATTDYVWIVSSVCDYSFFDFNYRSAPWEASQIHCWASGEQQQGDTFLIPVREFLAQDVPLEKLEWFKDVHYHYPGVSRFPLSSIDTSDPVTVANEVTDYYSVVSSITEMPHRFGEGMPTLWDAKYVYPLNKSGSVLLVPRQCRGKIKEQIYDYPHIDYRYSNIQCDEMLDIVFISNGEKIADENYEKLRIEALVRGNSLQRIDGIKGRTEAYQRAASLASTAWFFAVFAKCEIDDDFDFDWQPDYMQAPKHYIFHAKNPVNGLEYGHMGVIAYNRDLVLNPPNPIGIDFTLSAPHAVIPELSCVARFDTEPEVTWRTAFREALKLRQAMDTNYTVETEYRLHCWTTIGNGENGEMSVSGAKEAVRFYNEVNGDPEMLKLSYEWDWVDEHLRKSLAA